jgi:hypothetical protein
MMEDPARGSSTVRLCYSWLYMWNRVVQGTLIICAGLVLVLVGILIRPEDTSAYGGSRTSIRLIFCGIALTIGGIWFLSNRRKGDAEIPDNERRRGRHD